MGIQPPKKVSGPTSSSPSEEPEAPLQETFVNKLDSTSTELALMIKTPQLLDNPTSLETLASSIIALAGPAEQAAHLDEALSLENLKDAGEIVSNVLTQSLDVSDSEGDVSLLKAAQTFDPKQAMDSNLRKIMVNFVQFPEETELMLRELDLLLDDLA